MQPGCWLRATQPAVGAEDVAGRKGSGTRAVRGTVSEVACVEPSESVATLASISSIASTSAAAMAALKARPYLVPPFAATASAPPTPQPHVTSTTSMACTAPATPTRRRLATDTEMAVADFDIAELEEMVEAPPHTKTKSHRFFWRKALRRVFRRHK
ncbi:hypothetical protein KR026_004320 [Drosophila bipectinata]|nr:hypothetical protein KR026_004320 [Drosophila bipectinata]